MDPLSLTDGSSESSQFIFDDNCHSTLIHLDSLPLSVLSMLIIFVLLRGHVKGPLPARAAEIKYNHGEPIKRTFGQKLLRLDLFGAFLFIAGGILFILALNWGSTGAWSEARVIVCFILAGLLYIAFVMWEWVIEPAEDDYSRKRENWAPAWTKGVDPMIPLGMFKNYAVVVTCFAAMASGMVMLGQSNIVELIFLPLRLIDAQECSTSWQSSTWLSVALIPNRLVFSLSTSPQALYVRILSTLSMSLHYLLFRVLALSPPSF